MEVSTETQQMISNLVQINVKHVFSDEELLQKSSQLANTVNDKADVEAEKKSVAAEFKNKVDKYQADIKVLSGHISNGFAYLDVPAELWLDYTENMRVYKDKQNGEVIKTEPFHASDYQKKIDFTGISDETQEQIDVNNALGDFADFKATGVRLEKPEPKYNLGETFVGEPEEDDEMPY